MSNRATRDELGWLERRWREQRSESAMSDAYQRFREERQQPGSYLEVFEAAWTAALEYATGQK